MKKCILIFSCALFSLNVHAAEIIFGSGGYLGEYQIGAGNGNFSFIYGYTESGNIHQFTAKYDIISAEYFKMGAFLTYTPDDKFFYENPSRYPDTHYYGGNNARFGLSFSITIGAFYVSTSILDTSMTIIWNEPKYRNGFGWADERLWSTGFGFRFKM